MGPVKVSDKIWDRFEEFAKLRSKAPEKEAELALKKHMGTQASLQKKNNVLIGELAVLLDAKKETKAKVSTSIDALRGNWENREKKRKEALRAKYRQQAL